MMNTLGTHSFSPNDCGDSFTRMSFHSCLSVSIRGCGLDHFTNEPAPCRMPRSGRGAWRCSIERYLAQGFVVVGRDAMAMAATWGDVVSGFSPLALGWAGRLRVGLRSLCGLKPNAIKVEQVKASTKRLRAG